MEYFKVTFDSSANFDQMKADVGNQEVTMFCQECHDEVGGKEIIFILPTPADYKSDFAQFSISKKEAELIIGVFKLHFGI